MKRTSYFLVTLFAFFPIHGELISGISVLALLQSAGFIKLIGGAAVSTTVITMATQSGTAAGIAASSAVASATAAASVAPEVTVAASAASATAASTVAAAVNTTQQTIAVTGRGVAALLGIGAGAGIYAKSLFNKIKKESPENQQQKINAAYTEQIKCQFDELKKTYDVFEKNKQSYYADLLKVCSEVFKILEHHKIAVADLNEEHQLLFKKIQALQRMQEQQKERASA